MRKNDNVYVMLQIYIMLHIVFILYMRQREKIWRKGKTDESIFNTFYWIIVRIINIIQLKAFHMKAYIHTYSAWECADDKCVPSIQDTSWTMLLRSNIDHNQIRIFIRWFEPQQSNLKYRFGICLMVGRNDDMHLPAFTFIHSLDWWAK